MKYFLILTLSILLISCISAETTFYDIYDDFFIYSNPPIVEPSGGGGGGGGFYIVSNITNATISPKAPVIPTEITENARTIFESPLFWLIVITCLVLYIRKRTNRKV